MSDQSISSRSGTDWARLDAMSDEDIDYSDCPEVTPEMFSRAVIREGANTAKRKARVTLKIDADVLEWFQSEGNGYQSRINSLLRAHMESCQ